MPTDLGEVEVYASNPNTQGVVAGGLGVQCHPYLLTECKANLY